MDKDSEADQKYIREQFNPQREALWAMIDSLRHQKWEIEEKIRNVEFEKYLFEF
jgi:hypothetical protein